MTEGARRRGIYTVPPGVDAEWRGLDVLVLSPTPTYPIDAGNRRRIYFVNEALRQSGASVTFAHYPAEADWRARAPAGALEAMLGQWGVVHTIPVTRGLHEPSIGEDHAIDEWWDPAIGDMLSWLFRTHRFHVFLVNYAWLSKAFEYCPPNVLKILDTHDRLSGRRSLLMSHGIAPEFFHTTIEQERAALDRADVVWSIKSHEADFFRTITSRTVVNIPHIEPIAAAVGPRQRPGVLRFGLAGARNNINYVNFRHFLTETEVYVRRTLLPARFVVGGGICDMLRDIQQPWIQFLGRLPDMAHFYQSVDVVLAPISFSTGLKIKVGEALCQGKAVVALEHAFEGYRPCHPFHALRSIADMLRACRRIVNDPALIDELEDASLRSVARTQDEVSRGLRTTILERWRLTPGICFVVAAEDVHRGSLVVDHVREAARYLRDLAAAIVFVHGDTQAPDIDALRALAEAGALVLSPELNEALGPASAQRLDVGLLRVRASSELVADPHDAFWFASCLPGWSPPPKPWRTRAYISCDSVLQSSTPDELATFLALLRATFAEVVMVSRRGTPNVASRGTADQHHRVPLLRHGDASLVVGMLNNRAGDRVVILAEDIADPLLHLTARLALRLCTRPIDVVLPGRRLDPDESNSLVEALANDGSEVTRLRVVPAGRCFAPEADDRIGAFLVLDTAIDQTLDGLREVFDTAAVPRATLFADGFRSADYVRRETAGASGLFESVMLIERLLTRPGAAGALREPRAMAPSKANDAGWAWIWSEVTELARQNRANAHVGPASPVAMVAN